MLSLPPAHLLPPTPVPSLSLVSRRHACIYTMHAAPPLQTCSPPQACTTAAWGLLALLQLPLSAVPVYIVYPIVHTCYNLRAATNCAPLLHYCCTTAEPLRGLVQLSWHQSLPRRGSRPLKHTHTHRVPTLVAPLASSPWNLPTQAFTHPLCVPTAHTLIGILKLAVCPLVAPFKTDLDHIR